MTLRFCNEGTLGDANHLKFGKLVDECNDSLASAFFVDVKALADGFGDQINGWITAAFYFLPNRNPSLIQREVKQRFQIKEHARSVIQWGKNGRC